MSQYFYFKTRLVLKYLGFFLKFNFFLTNTQLWRWRYRKRPRVQKWRAVVSNVFPSFKLQTVSYENIFCVNQNCIYNTHSMLENSLPKYFIIKLLCKRFISSLLSPFMFTFCFLDRIVFSRRMSSINESKFR